MLKNYFKVAWRGLRRNRSASVINIAGLAIGIASCIMIFLYVEYEFSFDRFHSKADRVFRSITIDKALGVTSNNVGITMPMMGPTALEQFPEVEESVRILTNGRSMITYEDQNFYAEDAAYAESSFFEIFDYNLKNGQPGEVLAKPRTTVISESLAQKTFGQDDPIGKVLRVENTYDWEVVGVMEDMPGNSHLQFDMLLSMYPTEADSGIVQWLNTWRGLGMVNYLVLNDPVNAPKIEEQMAEVAYSNDVREVWVPQLQPLKDVHLGSADILFDGYNRNKSDIVYLYSLSAVAFFVMLIAAFNFMNLATAKSSTRAKEVGMRKVVGARKRSLVMQHLSESIFLCFLSLGIALILVSVAAPFVELPFDEPPIVRIFSIPVVAASILGGTLVLGLLAGSYPAFVLSRFKPIRILRGKFQGSKGGIILRKVLVVAQFTASITMIIGTVLVYQQLQFIKNKSLGFDKEQVVTFRIGDQELRQNFQPLKDRLQQLEQVKAVAKSSGMPGQGFGRTGLEPEGTDPEEDWIVSIMSMDENYLDLMGMELLDGRNYDRESGTDEREAIIINEAFARKVGWEMAVGKKITMGENERTVIGLVKDFHFASMRHEIEPIVIMYNPNPGGVLSVRLSGDDVRTSMAGLESIWREVNPNHPFEYQFFDEEFNQLYQSDETFSGLVLNFTWLAIFIACLGLFGLASYMAEQRTKEIGVRKVLGSSIGQIVMLLSKDFILLVMVANLIAWPLAYFSMKDWLADFQYRIDLLSGLGMAVFALSGFAAVAIALLTVSYQSISAARMSPVKSLRDE